MVDRLQSMPYSAPTFSIRTTGVFDTWFAGLPDRVAKRRIQARIDRLSMGNPGDWKSAGSPVVEMRIDHGRLSHLLRPARNDLGHPALRRR